MTPRHACSCCGYDLDGIRVGPGGSTCPECGNREPAPPSALAPWPPVWRVALQMVWPTAAVLIVVGVLVAIPHLEFVLWIGWSLGMMAWMMAAVVHPLFEAGELSRRHALVPQRRRFRALLGAGGIGVNIVATLGCLWVLSRL
ncbi:MAG: hypothetical protein IT437_06695 [Phycisphaerales bacterium]|nr:hypothetical protein [Phycisphaerales bacterium]